MLANIHAVAIQPFLHFLPDNNKDALYFCWKGSIPSLCKSILMVQQYGRQVSTACPRFSEPSLC
jgi:hypothetical protein